MERRPRVGEQVQAKRFGRIRVGVVVKYPRGRDKDSCVFVGYPEDNFFPSKVRVRTLQEYNRKEVK